MKRGMILLFVLLFLSILFLPQINAAEEDHAELGYECLQSLIDGRGCSSISLEEQVFSLLAIGECQSQVQSTMNPSNCWPGSGCSIKPTAQAIFSLANAGVDTTSAEDWLLTQTMAAQGLEWFLEIETVSPSACTAKYGTEVHQFTINEQREVSSSAGDCLVKTTDNPYWFRINPSCFEQEFKVTCDQSFLTTLLFKKQGSATLNVLDDIHSASANGETTEMVSARCFTEGGQCTYDGTLWATFALWAEGREVKPFIPYLTAMEEGNERFLPESFLYFLTGKFLPELLDKQKYNAYWEESGNRYYDTALALFPMYYQESAQKTYAKDWLLTNQEASGCWHGDNIVDTAFILHSVWPKFPGGTGCQSDEDCSFPGEICDVDTGRCYNPANVECGNDQSEPGEQCDGTDLGDNNCADVLQGIWSGELSCDENCDFVTSDCVQEEECTSDDQCPSDQICNEDGFCINPGGEPACPNGLKEDGEACDGEDLNGQTCESVMGSGWAGNLACTSDCNLDTSSCDQGGCTWNYDCPGEQICDGGTCVDKDSGGGGGIGGGGGGIGGGGGGKGGGIGGGGGGTGGGGSGGCTWDYQCPGEEVCEGGVCVDGDIGGEDNCTWDYQCPGEEICEDGICLNSTGEGETCNFDFECPGTQICENDTCIDSGAEGECTWSYQCPGEEICENGICTNSTGPGNGDECTWDFDCPDDEICESGNCIILNPESCNWDFECPGTQICENEVCINNTGNPGECVWDVDCGNESLVCEGGFCINISALICFNDWDCPGSDVCINGDCIVEGMECTSDYDCPDIQECVGGNCLYPGGNTTCESNYDCPGEQLCVEGICSNNAAGDDCQAQGYFCMSSTNCEGNIFPAYSCFYPYQCCDTEPPAESCFQQSGEICSSDEECIAGIELPASDLDDEEVCCTSGGYCIQKTPGRNCSSDYECYDDESCVEGVCELKSAYCEENEGHCRKSECEKGEKESYIYTCDYGDTCCVSEKEEPSGRIWLVVILLILVTFVVAGILFRDKLKLYWLKVKSKLDKSGGNKPPYGRRPGFPPGPPGHPMHGKPKKQGFMDKLKGMFSGKKKGPPHRNMPPQRPLRGPLAIQHAQRQGQRPNHPNRNRPNSNNIKGNKHHPIKPEPIKSTKTPFKSSEQKVKISKKKVPDNKPELNEVLDKLKKMSK